MADDFSKDDQKNIITNKVGKSPLEESMGGDNAVASSQSEPQISQSTNQPPIAESGPELTAPPAGTAKDENVGDDGLPPGVSSTGDTSLQSSTASPKSDAPLGEPPEVNVLSPKDELVAAKEPTGSTTTSNNPAVLDTMRAPLDSEPQLNNQTRDQESEPAKPSEAEQNFGEPAKAPDTDEFLKSILDDKTGIPGESASASNETSVANPSLEPTQNPSAGSNSSSPSSEGVPETSSQQSQPLANSQPNTSLNENSSLGQTNAAPSVPSGGVMLDNISAPGQGSGENEGESSISDDLIKSRQGSGKPKPSPIKIVLAVVLSVVIVAIGYYLYNLLFPSQTPEQSELSQNIDYAADLTTATSETYATDDEQRKADLNTIREALLNYYAGQGRYPVAENLTFLTAGNILEKELVPIYLDVFPRDPDPSKNYGYKSDGTTFILTAVLDDSADRDVTMRDGKPIYTLTDSTTAPTPVTNTGPDAFIEGGSSIPGN